jgi:hypothetical protein
LLIRWNFTFPIPSFSYKNILQSHSHVAFLGWGFMVVVYTVYRVYLTNIQQCKLIYKVTLPILFLTIFLMLISFPISGYKLFSIILLTVFGITSYVLLFQLLKDLTRNTIPVKFIKYGIYYYILSSLATWFLAFVLMNFGKTDLYYNTVYFYLHFLYNGFFVFTLFGLLFKLLEINKVSLNIKYVNNFFVYLNIACIPSYALSVLWSKVSSIFYIIGFAASFLQIIALFFLFKIAKNIFAKIHWHKISIFILKFLLIAFALKIIMQFFSSFPYFVEKSLALKPYFIIGYLHLFTLGFMSVFLLLILKELTIITFNSIISKVGILMFLLGVFVTEVLFFTQGFLLLVRYPIIENYNKLLLIFSFLIVSSLMLIFINLVKNFNKLL